MYNTPYHTTDTHSGFNYWFEDFLTCPWVYRRKVKKTILLILLRHQLEQNLKRNTQSVNLRSGTIKYFAIIYS